jgi:glycosyltransferase involved in cell wall biosynthesis
VLPFLPHLESKGIEVQLSPLMDDSEYKLVHKPGLHGRKGAILARGLWNRVRDLTSAKRFDAVYIQREAYSFGPPVVEYLLNKFNGRLVLDVDDAIFEPFSHSSAVVDSIAYRLKYGARTFRVARWARVIHAGNTYLRERLASVNRETIRFPTVMDTNRYPLKPSHNGRTVTIGWIGSSSTTVYLRKLDEVFRKLIARHGDNISFHFVGTQHYDATVLGTQVRISDWDPDREVDYLHGFDIGIMPMDDSEWSKGRCGTKMLQYMAVGVPAVCSPEGAVTDIIQSGRNGVIAKTDEEWIESISDLVYDIKRRQAIGAAGRETIHSGYSVREWAPRFVQSLEQAASS